MKFNYKKGSATKKGKVKTIKVLTPDHTLYPVFFKANGHRREPEQIKADLEMYKETK